MGCCESTAVNSQKNLDHSDVCDSGPLGTPSPGSPVPTTAAVVGSRQLSLASLCFSSERKSGKYSSDNTTGVPRVSIDSDPCTAEELFEALQEMEGCRSGQRRPSIGVAALEPSNRKRKLLMRYNASKARRACEEHEFEPESRPFCSLATYESTQNWIGGVQSPCLLLDEQPQK